MCLDCGGELTGLDCWDDLNGRGTGADDSDALVGKIEILGIVTSVHQLSAKRVEPGDVGPLPPAGDHKLW